MTDELKGKIAYTYLIYDDHAVSHGGYLPDFERGAHACWYYMVCAHQNLESAARGAILEGEVDTIESLNNIARSVATMYQLESPDDFLKFMDVVMKEADRCDMGWDPETLKPWLKDFRTTLGGFDVKGEGA